MSLSIPLSAVPSQRFGVRLGGDRFEIELKSCNGVMCATISRNDTPLVSGSRCVAGTPLLPYKYLETGNFIFLTENDELPNWESFGATQSLVYLTAAEVSDARN